MSYKEEIKNIIENLNSGIYKDEQCVKEIIHKLKYKKSENAFKNFIKKEIIKLKRDNKILNIILINILVKNTQRILTSI